MAVTDAWTNPVEGWIMDLDVGSVFTDAIYDYHCSDLLYLGGTDGKRGKVRSLWAQPHAAVGTNAVLSAVIGYFSSSTMTDLQSNTAFASMFVPSDFAALKSLRCIMIPYATGDMYANHSAEYAAPGQLYTTHLTDSAYTAVPCTLSQILSIDMSADVAALAANDILGLRFSRDAANAADTLSQSVYVIGFLLEYYTA